MPKADIGIIGAMQPEIEDLVASLKSKKEEKVGGLVFYRGKLGKTKVVITKCGVGKVFAAMAAQALIMKYSPKLIINTGVGGAIARGLSVGDVLVADKVCQHDMDTSAIGDPKGLISGINKIFFEADKRAPVLISKIAKELGIRCVEGTVASGDVFVSSSDVKEAIRKEFSASVCEMEGGAIAQVAFVNSVPFAVIRAISDSADEESSVSYEKFLPEAAKKSADIVKELCRQY